MAAGHIMVLYGDHTVPTLAWFNSTKSIIPFFTRYLKVQYRGIIDNSSTEMLHEYYIW